MAALYHTHRPQTFASIIGQSHIIRTLENQIRRGTAAHAYLFSGPRGVGKTTSARVIAKAVNCLERPDTDAEPCNQCTSCTAITAGRAIDVIEIDAASHTGVDSVRENIIENAQFQPTMAKMKVFIIDEVHMLSTSAFNALLKTLEEPPHYVMFILATTEKHKLPATIISRCQRFDFEHISYDEMKTHLEQIAAEEQVEIAPAVIDRIIAKSDGCARDAVSLLDQLMATGESVITEEIAVVVLPTSDVDSLLTYAEALIDRDSTQAFSTLHTLSRSNTDLTTFAKDLSLILRDILIRKLAPQSATSGTDLSHDATDRIAALANGSSARDLVLLIDLIIRRMREIKAAPLPELPLELAITEWCVEGDTPASSPKSESATQPTTPITKPSPLESRTIVKEVTEAAVAPPMTVSNDSEEDLSSVSRTIDETSGDVEPLTEEAVRDKWPEFLRRFAEGSMSLMVILGAARIRSVSGREIELSVPYAFHVDTLSDASCRRNMAETMSALLARPVTIRVSLDEENSTAETPVDPDLANLASEFGGVVI